MVNTVDRTEGKRGAPVTGWSRVNDPADSWCPTEAPNLFGLTIDDIEHPAYMLNYNFELTWYNEAARQNILGFEAPPQGAESRNIFRLLSQQVGSISAQRRNELLCLYASLGRQHLSRESLLGIVGKLDQEAVESINAIYDNPDSLTRKMIVNFPCAFTGEDGMTEAWRVYGIYFREGVLIIHVPEEVVDTSLLEILSRRDAVVRNLMSKQLPVFTPLLALEADLADSMKIRAELPPGEYFQLIEEIWSATAPVFRKHYGAYGRYCGNGVRYYFLPRLDCNYILSARECADELKQEIKKISARWQLRKKWFNQLRLNVRLQKGQEWLGTLQSETNVQFTPRKDIDYHDASVGAAARTEAYWAIKIPGKHHSTGGTRLRLPPHAARAFCNDASAQSGFPLFS